MMTHDPKLDDIRDPARVLVKAVAHALAAASLAWLLTVPAHGATVTIKRADGSIVVLNAPIPAPKPPMMVEVPLRVDGRRTVVLVPARDEWRVQPETIAFLEAAR